MNDIIPKRWLTLTELANYIGFAEGTIYNWVYSGKIPFCRIGGRLRFDRNKIDQWMYYAAYDPQRNKT